MKIARAVKREIPILEYAQACGLTPRKVGAGEYTLEEDDKEFFVCGGQMEREYLELPDDREQMYKLEKLNRGIGPRGIHAMEAENKGTKGET